MTDRRWWIRAAVGAVVGVKLLGLASLIVASLGAGDGQVFAPSTSVPALAADAAGLPVRSGGPTAPAETATAPLRIPGDEPGTAFTDESRGVRELIEAIQRREAELAQRDAVLSRREAAMRTAARDLDGKIAHLETLAAKAGSESPAGASMEQLGKIYGAMKAEEASPLLDRLDNETIRAIFANMKQRQISAILPLMNPDKAVALTELLGGREQHR